MFLFISLAIVLGIIFTSVTLLVNRQSSFDGCEEFGVHQVQKGFPLPIILVRPSVSLCNPVESISILWEGNAYHEQYPMNTLTDLIFWSGISFLGILGFIRLRASR
jgi:hypothetical protein